MKKYNSEAERALASERVGLLFKRYALPGVVGFLFLGIQSIIDGLIVGNTLGANALASVSLIIPCFSLMSSFCIMIGIGCQTLVSINLGRGKPIAACNAMTTGLMVLIVFSVLVPALLLTFDTSVITFLGANDVLAQDARSYMRAIMWFMPMVAMLFFGDFMLKSTGHPRYSMIIMSSTVILNIALTIIFITQFGWGVAGAGYATGIAFSLGAISAVTVAFKPSNIATPLRGRFIRGMVWPMFYNGSSEGFSDLSKGITILLFNITLMHYIGEAGVAAFIVIEYIAYIGITIFLGVSDGVIPILSFNYGAQNPSRIRRIFTIAAKSNITIGIIFWAAMFFFPKQLISLFLSNDNTQVMEMATRGAMIYSFSFLVNGFNILSSSFFTALANAKISIIISLLRSLILVGCMVVTLPVVIGIDGIWLSVPLAEVGTIAVSFFLVRGVFRKWRYGFLTKK